MFTYFQFWPSNIISATHSGDSKNLRLRNRKLLNLVNFCDRIFYLSLKLIKFLRLNKITLVDFDEYVILNLIVLVECD